MIQCWVVSQNRCGPLTGLKSVSSNGLECRAQLWVFTWQWAPKV